jgi:hypothetical protein
MQEAELKYADRLKNGTPQNFVDLLGTDSAKKRKRRTSFTPQALEVLNEAFERNTHPSGADMTLLANKLSNDREVIRVWFCNKRQALKNTIKKYKTGDISLTNENSNGQTTASLFATAGNNNNSNLNSIQEQQQQQISQVVSQTSLNESVTGATVSSS